MLVIGFYVGILVELYWHIAFAVLVIGLFIYSMNKDDILGVIVFGGLMIVCIGIGLGDTWYYFFMYDAPVELVQVVTQTPEQEKSFSIIEWLNSKPLSK